MFNFSWPFAGQQAQQQSAQAQQQPNPWASTVTPTGSLFTYDGASGNINGLSQDGGEALSSGLTDMGSAITKAQQAPQMGAFELVHAQAPELGDYNAENAASFMQSLKARRQP